MIAIAPFLALAVLAIAAILLTLVAVGVALVARANRRG
jgi:hypothetical protein